MSSLREFQALNSLSTKHHLLHRSKLDISSMTKLLPRTLERLRLCHSGRWNEFFYCKLVDEILTLKDEQVPRLKSIQYLFDQPFDSWLSRKCFLQYREEKHYVVADVDIRIKIRPDLVKFEVLEGSTLVGSN